MDWISDGWEFDNKWFYDRQVTFKRTEGEIADDGLYSKSNSTDTLTVDCDLQPVSRDDVIDDSGLILDAEYKIFCDANTFIKQCQTLEYNGDDYNVIKIVDWDDYYIVLIKAVK